MAVIVVRGEGRRGDDRLADERDERAGDPGEGENERGERHRLRDVEGEAGEDDLAVDIAPERQDQRAGDDGHGDAPELAADGRCRRGVAEGDDRPLRREPDREGEEQDGADALPQRRVENEHLQRRRRAMGQCPRHERAGEAHLLVAPALVGRGVQDRVAEDAGAELRQAVDGVGGKEKAAAVGALVDAHDLDLGAGQARPLRRRGGIAGKHGGVDRRKAHQHVLQRGEGGAARLGPEGDRGLAEVEQPVGAGEHVAEPRLPGEARAGGIGREGGVELGAERAGSGEGRPRRPGVERLERRDERYCLCHGERPEQDQDKGEEGAGRHG